MKKFQTLKDCLKQLECCDYKDEIGHSLGLNSAFIQLKEYIDKENEAMEKPEMPGLRTIHEPSKFDEIWWKIQIVVIIATICAVPVILALLIWR